MTTKRINTAVWLEKYSRWQLKVQKDGERKTFTCSTPGRKGQIECNRKADMWLAAGAADPQRVRDFYNVWIEELKISTSYSHWEKYERIGKYYIIPEIGARKMDSLNEQHLQNVILRAYKNSLSGKKLSHKYLATIRTCLVAFMKFGRKNSQTTLLPESLYIPKEAPKGKRTILQPDSLKRLLTKDTVIIRGNEVHEIFIYAFRFAAFTGLRPGELFELKTGDISGKTLTVSGSYNKFLEHTRGKNENARRSFVMNGYAIEVLREQQKMLTETGVQSEYVFCDKRGEQIVPHIFYKHWVRYRDCHGLEKVSPYELRHTFMSMIQNLPDGIIKPLAGHSYSFDTRSVYVHEIDGEQNRAAEAVSLELKSILEVPSGL